MRNSRCSCRRGRGQGWGGEVSREPEGGFSEELVAVPALQLPATELAPGAVLRQRIRTPSHPRATAVTSKVVATVGREGGGRSLDAKL